MISSVDLIAEKRKLLGRSESYRQLIQMWAWKDLLTIVHEIQAVAVKSLDRIPSNELKDAGFHIAEARGIRKGLDSLLGEVDSILSSGDLASEELKVLEKRK